MAKWAALVYGRTYEVDFRFLALPNDLASDARTWAERHVLATTRVPERLVDGPRWALFQNERYCVVGVACMAHDLVGAQETDGDDIRHDSKGRPLYLFAGYVAKREPAQQSVAPSIEPIDERLDIFRPLCEAVRTRWWDKHYDEVKSTTSSYESVEVLDQELADDGRPPIVLNSHPDYIFLWPEQERTTVWQVGTLYAQKSARMSVCLGLPSQKEAIEGPFFNGTSSDVQKEIQLERDAPSKPSSDRVAKGSKKEDQAKSAPQTSSSQAGSGASSGAHAAESRTKPSGSRKAQSTSSHQPSSFPLEKRRMAYWRALQHAYANGVPSDRWREILEKYRKDFGLSEEEAQQIEREYQYWRKIPNGKVDAYLREVQERVRQRLGKGQRIKAQLLYWEALKSAYAHGEVDADGRKRLERVQQRLGLWWGNAKWIEGEYRRAKYREAIETVYANGKVASLLRETLEKVRQRLGLSREEAMWIKQEYLYWQALESAYADGEPDADGRKRLEKVRQRLGLSENEAIEIEEEYLGVSPDILDKALETVGDIMATPFILLRKGLRTFDEHFNRADNRSSQQQTRQVPPDKRQAPADQRRSLYGSFKKEEPKESKESKEDSDKKDHWF